MAFDLVSITTTPSPVTSVGSGFYQNLGDGRGYTSLDLWLGESPSNVADGTFESYAVGAGAPRGWVGLTGGVAEGASYSVTNEGVNGSKAVRLTVGSGALRNARLTQQSIRTCTPGQTIRFTVAARTSDTLNGRIRIEIAGRNSSNETLNYTSSQFPLTASVATYTYDWVVPVGITSYQGGVNYGGVQGVEVTSGSYAIIDNFTVEALAISNRPSAPTNVSSSQTSTSATVTWAVPSSNGGSPITGYFVGRDGQDSGGYGAWSTVMGAEARSITFLSLVPGATYNLTIAAINANGQGESAVRTVTIAPPLVSGVFPRAAWLNKPLPTSPVIDESSASMASRITNYNKVLITYDYANPVFKVTDADPLKTVVVTSPYGSAYHSLETRIPNNAVAASGSDGWAVFEDPTPRPGYPNGVVDNYWVFDPNGGGPGMPTAYASGRYARDGEGTSPQVSHFADWDDWFIAAKAAGYIYENEAAPQYLYNNPLTQGTASGVSVYAGLVTPADIAAGVIKHTLVCAINPDVIAGSQRRGAYRYPAYSTDSYGPSHVPGQTFIMGSKLRFPASWTPPADMNSVAKMVGIAIRDYGLVITDMAPGGGISLGCQRAITPSEQASYAAVGMGQGNGYFGINELPWNQIQILKRWDGTNDGVSARLL